MSCPVPQVTARTDIERQTKQPITPVFVFGSNLAGRHGKGAALYAREHHGAIYGQSEGLQGNSYGIPTKDASIRTLPLETIAGYVTRFKAFAAAHPDHRFQVTAIGCGLAGYSPTQIAPLFRGAPSNCILPAEFVAVLEPRKV
jgi:hypothetical protein